MDYRDFVVPYSRIFEVTSNKLHAYVEIDGVKERHWIKWVVCPVCEGLGSYVNPNIDRHGIPSNEMASDPEFSEDYYNGRYDVRCGHCLGERVVPAIDERIDPEAARAFDEQQVLEERMRRDDAMTYRLETGGF